MMGLELVVWLCTLPFVALLIASLFGVKTAAVVALLLLIAMLVYCWGNCIPLVVQFCKEKFRDRHKQHL